ncbi:uncharacterized protein LOC143513831 [Brachyhypopomus gauderio]|uniref:uncharacterized protein LOC143513831 n=1 Tax=Brachyhypopomus gauderio TaxID=698409 RepID=UPI00404222A8
MEVLDDQGCIRTHHPHHHQSHPLHPLFMDECSWYPMGRDGGDSTENHTIFTSLMDCSLRLTEEKHREEDHIPPLHTRRRNLSALRPYRTEDSLRRCNSSNWQYQELWEI